MSSPEPAVRPTHNSQHPSPGHFTPPHPRCHPPPAGAPAPPPALAATTYNQQGPQRWPGGGLRRYPTGGCCRGSRHCGRRRPAAPNEDAGADGALPLPRHVAAARAQHLGPALAPRLRRHRPAGHRPRADHLRHRAAQLPADADPDRALGHRRAAAGAGLLRGDEPGLPHLRADAGGGRLGCRADPRAVRVCAVGAGPDAAAGVHGRSLDGQGRERLLERAVDDGALLCAFPLCPTTTAHPT